MEKFIQLKEEVIQVAPDQKIIKAVVYADYVAAGELIESARIKAATIVADAEAVYSSEKERGYRDGLEQGKLQVAEQMLETVTRTVGYFEGIEGQIVETVHTALRKILGRFDDRELIVDMVKTVLAAVRNQKQVNLRIAPGLVETVRSELGGISAAYPTIHFIEIVPDTRLEGSGCILESEIGVVDASLEVQLTAIRNALLKGFTRNKNPDPVS